MSAINIVKAHAVGGAVRFYWQLRRYCLYVKYEEGTCFKQIRISVILFVALERGRGP